jgi:hypothetical protein
MIIHIAQARVVGPHSLELTFDNGAVHRLNLRRELVGPIFEPLRDPAYFAQVRVDGGTVAWPNGADFAPDFLYEMAADAISASAD